MNEEQVKSELKAWMAKVNGKIDAADIGDEDPILDRQIISSLKLMEFVMFIEKLRGARIPPDELQPTSFTSVNQIVAAFFADDE